MRMWNESYESNSVVLSCFAMDIESESSFELMVAPELVHERVEGMVYMFKDQICVWRNRRWYCGAHNRQRGGCVPCGGSSTCEHKRKRSACVDCGGSGVCLHGRQRAVCVDCGGVSICEHKRQRHVCVECMGTSVCEHKRMRSVCRECGGAQICQHNRVRHTCVECGGSSVCEHRRQRVSCHECGGSAICEHNHQRTTCFDCKGWAVCEHNMIRSRCHRCEGDSLCTHCKYALMNKKYKPHCAACYFHLNPDAPVTRQNRNKERHLYNELTKAFPNHPFVWDKRIDGGCSARRPDFRWECNTHSIILECDEQQHATNSAYNTECENKRSMQIWQDLGSRPLVVIRFNPDGYTSSEGYGCPHASHRSWR